MALPHLPQLTPAAFRWHTSPQAPRVTQRLANGTEAWVGIRDENAKGQYDNYLNTTLRINNISSLSLARLKEDFAAVLMHIRFQHPEVACTAVWEETGPPHIQYTPPRGNAEALAWARETIEIRTTSKTGLDLRRVLESQRRRLAPKPAKSVVTFLVADTIDENTTLASGATVDILMHFNHIYWDGISARMFVGDLLRRFGERWGGTEQQLPEYRWGEEVANLSQPLLDACKVDVEALRDEFYKAREEFVTSLMNSGSSWGLNVQNKIGTPCTEWYNFSEAESKRIIRAVKERMGQQYTISHLGHAATVLALLKAKPLLPGNPDDTALIMPLPVNGRRYLRDEYHDKQYGACQASAIVEIETLKSWLVDSNDKQAVKATLERGCQHIKNWYDYWLRKEFQLALGVSKDNFLSALFSSGPMPFTGSSIPVAKIFVSDGIVDNYVPSEIVSRSGEKLMAVDNCAFFLDTYLPDILIRMDSWKGATAMSLCFNDGYYSAEDAAKFLTYIADFMRAFTDN